MEDLLQIGVITSTHGIKGEVKVFPTTDDNNRFKVLKDCFIEYKNEMIVNNNDPGLNEDILRATFDNLIN